MPRELRAPSAVGLVSADRQEEENRRLALRVSKSLVFWAIFSVASAVKRSNTEITESIGLVAAKGLSCADRCS
jgi:hypothetical protein